MMFPTAYEDVLERIEKVNPVRYAKTRNYIDGDVSYLSPYISRGVISTKQVMLHILDRGYDLFEVEKFIQELAWRDYWQQVWKAKCYEIDNDLKHMQTDVDHHQMPTKILDAQTGIDAIDDAINELYVTGYMHNHVRMYTASLACNVAKSHWHNPAKWFYAHLLDGDWASNALSWQWVAGSNSNKKYFANQKNVNTYCNTAQQDTVLSVSYEELQDLHSLPNDWRSSQLWELETKLPFHGDLELKPEYDTLIYNYYNLDPEWYKNQNMNRVLLLEPSVFKRYPIEQRPLRFALELSYNIPGIQIFVGEFEDLEKIVPGRIIFKEHPLNNQYKGQEEPRDWMFNVHGYFPSFFAYWKRCKKEWSQLKSA